jgi:hypothetical protein
MKALLAIERRLQDMERKFENKERLGKIVDTKYENNRWYVKLNDGDDDQPSGSESSHDPMGGGGTFKSDWQPWKSFSHGTIKMSVPPKKGQYALLRSSGGHAELSTVEPHHYGPENPSPHGEHDEVVHLIEDEDDDSNGEQGGGSGGGESAGGSEGGEGEDKWNQWVRQTKNTHHLIIRKKEQEQSGGQQGGGTDASAAGAGGEGSEKKKQRKTRKIPEVDEDEGDEKTTQIKSTNEFILKTVGKNKSYQRMDNDKIHTRYGEKDEKGDMLMDEDQVKVQFKDKKAMVKWTEEDLTHQMGEDDKSKVVFTEDNIVLTQGGDNASKTVWSKDSINITQGDGTRIVITKEFIEVKGASDASIGVDGAWVHCVGGKVHLGVPDAKGTAPVKVLTEAGPSSKVFAMP